MKITTQILFSESKNVVSDFYRNSEEGSSTCPKVFCARHFENHEVLTVFMLTANRGVFSILVLA